MKRPYSLDYSVERDTDRLEIIKEVLDTLQQPPTQNDLEQFASYILYGRDENGQNAVQRREMTDSDKRYNSYKRKEDTNFSLDGLLDNPMTDQVNLTPYNAKRIYVNKKDIVHRPKYDKKTGELIDPGDSDIPGMQELWERVDYLEKVLAANEGKIPMDPSYSVMRDSFRLYQLKHLMIDVRRHQYYLKDYYKPTLKFVSLVHPSPQTYNWDEDSYYWISYDQLKEKAANSFIPISTDLHDYLTKDSPNGLQIKWVVREHTFDWENPKHIRALIDFYSPIYMELYDKLDSWGRTLIYDFDRYFDMCHFSPVREYILTRKIDKASIPTIVKDVQEKFGIKYNETHIQSIINREIPETMARVATMHRMMLTTPPEDRKVCFTCKRSLPRNNYFFATNNNRRDHFGSNCKECERAKRIAKGEQTTYDRRNKDAALHEVPPREEGK